MKFKLKGDRILLFCDKVEEKKVGRLYTPETHSEPTRIATVIDVGDEVKDYIVGDRVSISFYTGVKVYFMGKKVYGEDSHPEAHRIVREIEILSGIVEE